MTNKHPITPPQEKVDQWGEEWHHSKISDTVDLDNYLATQAAQWGADQELEAMLAELKALHLPDCYAAKLRAARRPRLKEQAFAALKNSPEDPVDGTLRLSADAELIISRAVEASDD